MTHIIRAHTPDHALEMGLHWLRTDGVVATSRNGRVIRAPEPVITVWTDPTQRVIFSPLRDANPFFHLFEAVWMLAGRNDAAALAPYNTHMATFSDMGKFWGAYGHRWRQFFGFDQLKAVIALLRRDPSTRRCVLNMWAPHGDLVQLEDDEAGTSGQGSKDLPCNTSVYFDGSLGKLDMTVNNRSNDIVWGAYGANVVHMSMLHEFVALATQLPVGTYYQFSNNYHAYLDRPDVQRLIDTDRPRVAWQVNFQASSYYNKLRPCPLMYAADDWELWLEDAASFTSVAMPQMTAADDSAYRSSFFKTVLQPMMRAFICYKADDYGGAFEQARDCRADDWRYAAVDWIARRLRGRAAKGDSQAVAAVAMLKEGVMPGVPAQPKGGEL